MADTEKMTPMFEDDEGLERLYLYDNIEFTLTNGAYVINGEDPDSFLGMGGEAVVYKGINRVTGAPVAVKIYDTFNNQERRRHKEMSVRFSREFQDYKTFHLMPILDYGDITIRADGEETRYFADVMPFLSDGKITKLTYEELRDGLIPQIFKAMNILHGEDMIHRDIKPDNVFRVVEGNGTYYILSDFGTMRRTTGGVNFTQTRTGTPGYTAPEVFTARATPLSDFFSFGCTIATLYHGEHVYRLEIEQDEPGRLSDAMKNKGFPLNCPKKDKPLQELVNELTAWEEERRAGKERVQEWLNAPESFKCRYSIRGKQPLHFRNGETEFFSFKELAEYLSINWGFARSVLFRGILKNSLDIDDAGLSLRIADISEMYRATEDQDLGVALALNALYPEGPLCWRGERYESAGEISEKLCQNSDDENIADMLCKGYMSKKLSLNSFDKEVVSKITEIEEIAQRGEITLGMRMLRIAFSPTEEGRMVRGAKTINELFETVLNDKHLYYAIGDAFSDTEFLAFIAVNGKKDSVLNLPQIYRNGIMGKGPGLREMLTAFFLLAEDCMTEKKNLHECYINFGPHSHEVWVARNMKYFNNLTINASRAAHLVEQKLALVSPNDHIGVIKVKLDDLAKAEQNYLRYFQGNPFLADKKIFDGREDVTANNYRVYYADGLFGEQQMIGYLEMMYGRI